MDASDDAGVDAEGPLDPRIQIELENLNNATDEINKLEIELDEAHTAFRQLLSDSTRRLKEIANKIGGSCIEKARCYYKALEVAQQAQVQCQRQAQRFQRASEIHSAAKETVALAETRFISHQHEWNFDQAWQDMLNHATIKVMDADNQKAECGREHLRRAKLFHDAEKKVQHLEEKHRRAIIKSRPYFEVRAQCDEMLATQKSRVECLQTGVKKAKDAYATSLRILEDISNQIHQQRRDYDIMTKGPREPGVGAELVSPPESLSYETELDKLSLSRINSLASSEPDIDERTQDFEDVFELKQRMEQLSARSVDGSESISNQWELELQASVERLNTLPIKKLNSTATEETTRSFPNDNYNESAECLNFNCYEEYKDSDGRPALLSAVQKMRKNDDNESRKLSRSLINVKKPLVRTDATMHHRSWNPMSQSPTNSGFHKSETFSTNGFSKSLNNSLANIGNFIFKKNSVGERESETCKLPESGLKNESDLGSGDFAIQQCEGLAKDVDKCDEVGDVDPKQIDNCCGKKKIFVDTSNVEISEFTEATLNKEQIHERHSVRNANTLNFINDYAGYQSECDSKCEFSQQSPKFRETQDDPKISNRTNAESNKIKHGAGNVNFGSNSSVYTRERTQMLKSKVAKSYENNLDRDFVNCPKSEKPSPKTSSVKELPLLSIIHRFPDSRFSKVRSCSMTDLADKQNIKTLTDQSNS